MIDKVRHDHYIELTKKIFDEITQTGYHRILDSAAKLADEGKYVESMVRYFHIYKDAPIRNLASLVNNRLMVFAEKGDKEFEKFLNSVVDKGFYDFLCPHTISLIEKLANKKYLKPLHIDAEMKSLYAYEKNSVHWPPHSSIQVQELVKSIGKGDLKNAQKIYSENKVDLKTALAEACLQRDIKAFNLTLNAFKDKSDDLLEYFIYSLVRGNDYPSLKFVLKEYPSQLVKVKTFVLTMLKHNKDVSNVYLPL